jgi:AcrR family transcriptional regulator
MEDIPMRKGTPEEIAQKREEIINACEQLYQTMSFREITLKEIGKITSFSRPTIYNYFVTKEEIFLALFKREYDRWNEQLTAILDQNVQLTRVQLADQIAQSLAERQQLLKLLSMNNFDMEANSRQEMLTIFKQSYGGSLHRMCMLLDKFCPDMNETEIQNFIYTFFPFMFGIYPYTAVTEKQKTAMKDAGINYVYQTVYDLTYSCLVRLLGE